MKNKITIYEKVLADYKKKQDDLENKRNEKIEDLYKKVPIIKKIDDRINAIGIKSGINLLKGIEVDFKGELEELKDAKDAQLITNGYKLDYLEDKYECEKCKDTGFIGLEECSCFKQAIAREYYKMSNLDKVLDRENFLSFDFNVFSDEIIEEEDISPRENIKEIVRASEKFIRNFENPEEYNLLFFGSTGLGKTFMLNCIAKELLDLGYTVIYQTSHNLLGIVEEYKFSKTDNIKESKRKYDYLLEADLLIIDDLGTESANVFTISELFNILNTRNLREKKILISTNLSPGEISRTYTDRIYSRILDKFNIYKFIGSDLRWSGY